MFIRRFIWTGELVVEDDALDEASVWSKETKNSLHVHCLSRFHLQYEEMKHFKTAVIFYMSYLLILFVQDTENVLTKNTHKTISHNFISQNVGFKKQYETENLK